jgi:putative FmdB family regulatory protein
VPIYEYDCQDCNHTFEELVFSGSEQVKCPKCGQNKVQRKMSVFCSGGGPAKADFSAPSGGGCGSGGFS